MPRLVPVTIIGWPSNVTRSAGAVLRPGVEAAALPDGLAVGLVEGDDAVLAAGLEDGQVLVDQHRLGIAPSARRPAELLGFAGPFLFAAGSVVAADQAVAAEDVEISVVDHRRGTGAVGPAATLAVLRLPERLAVQIEGEDHQLSVPIAADVDLSACHGHAGETDADVIDLPEQLRPCVGPLLSRPVSSDFPSWLGPRQQGHSADATWCDESDVAAKLRDSTFVPLSPISVRDVSPDDLVLAMPDGLPVRGAGVATLLLAIASLAATSAPWPAGFAARSSCLLALRRRRRQATPFRRCRR